MTQVGSKDVGSKDVGSNGLDGSDTFLRVCAIVWAVSTFAIGAVLVYVAINTAIQRSRRSTIADAYAGIVESVYSGDSSKLPQWATLGGKLKDLKDGAELSEELRDLSRSLQKNKKAVEAAASVLKKAGPKSAKADADQLRESAADLKSSADSLADRLKLASLKNAANVAHEWVGLHKTLLDYRTIDALIDDEQARHGFAYRRCLAMLLLGAGFLCLSLAGIGFPMGGDRKALRLRLPWLVGAPIAAGAVLILGGVFIVDENQNMYSELPRAQETSDSLSK